MRKQTKLVAVLSTAALLAIGASMTSFAATGWQEEDGTWVYYNRDEERAVEEWKRSGNNWFWLDDNGEMAVDQLIEDDDDYYYVNESGAMVSNQWVAIENEDAGEEDEPDVYWYYFQANGKAYKRSENAAPESIAAKTINGKRYSFDTEGRMLFGWVGEDGERLTDDDAWKEADYYFGDENDGAMAQEWRLISIIDEDAVENLQPGDEFWDEEQDRWFYFLSSGKKVKADDDDVLENDQAIKTRSITGRKYGFDQYGRMIGNWYIAGTAVDADSDGVVWEDEDGNEHIASQGNASYSASFMYFNNPEDGARVTDDWFRVIPGYYLDQEKYDDGEIYWYHSDNKGKLYTNTIETIKGKKYAFDEYGRMIDGLALIRMAVDEDHDNRILSSTIADKIDSDEGLFDYDTEDNFNNSVAALSEELSSGLYRFYYFGDAEDGAMKTGKQTVEIDGDSFTFKFKDSTSSKGASIHGEDDDKLYAGGKLIEASSDEKYQAVLRVEFEDWTETDGDEKITHDGFTYLKKLDVDDFLAYLCDDYELYDNGDPAETEEDADEEHYSVLTGDALAKGVNEVLALDDIDHVVTTGPNKKGETEINNAKVYLHLVNTSGSMVKKKSAAKDGSDYKFEVENYVIKSVSNDI